jgi:AcrR family transcriptional regulator
MRRIKPLVKTNVRFSCMVGLVPKVTQQYRDDRREQILAAARRCFLRDGFHATSMQDLFAEAGLSSGAVYRYFASKDDVILAIAEENVRDVSALIREIAAEQPGRSVGAVLADVLDLIETKHEAAGLGGLVLLVWAEAMRNPRLQRQLVQLVDQLRDDLGTVVRAAQQGGDLPAGTDATSLTSVLMAIVPGFILQRAVTGPAATAGMADAVRALWP